jgi:hypothetical protein
MLHRFANFAPSTTETADPLQRADRSADNSSSSLDQLHQHAINALVADARD